LINGKNYDWEDVVISLSGVPVLEVTEINYSDEKEAELLYAAGSKPIGVGKGNYKASGDITFKRSSFDDLNLVAKAGGKSIYDFKPFPIIVSFGAKTISDDSKFIEVEHSPLHTETLMNVMFTKRTYGTKQNDKENTVKAEFIFEKIA
jgi:hypothetical protein